jgi:hypothetical protein
MATADEYAAWIVANASKKGTPEFETVAKAYEVAKGEAAAPPAPAPAPAPAEGEPMELEITGGQTVSPEEYAQQYPGARVPETTAAGMVGSVVRGIAPGAVMAGLGALAAPVAGVPVAVGAGLGAAALGASQLLGLDTGFVENLQGLLTRAGVAEPQTATERLLKAAAGGVTSGAAGVSLGQGLMKSATPLVRTAGAMLSEAPASQIASDIVGSSAAQAASELGLGPGGQIVAAIIGGGAGGKLPASGRAVPNPLTAGEFGKQAKRAVESPFGGRTLERLASEIPVNPEVVAAADRLGITQYLQPDHITTSQVVREIGQAVKSTPGSAARAAEMEGLARVGDTAVKLIEDLGGTRDLSTLNKDVRATMQRTTEALKTKSDALYKEISQDIPANTRVRADKTLAYIQKRAKEMNGVENLTPIEKDLLSKLTPQQIPSKSGKSVREIHPTYALVDELRKDAGEIGGGASLIPDRSKRIAKDLTKLLDEDQGVAAQAAGALDKWTQAKEAVRLRKGVEDDMKALFGKAFDESLVDNLVRTSKGLSKGDADSFAKMIKAIPDNMRSDVVTSALATSFGNATKNGELNFNTFTKFYDGITRNKQAAAALFSNLPPGAKSRFDDLAKVGKSISQATRENIPTGRLQSTEKQLEEADNFASTVYSIASRAAIGIPIEAAASSVGLRGLGISAGITSALMKQRTTAAKAADAVLLSPEFQRLVVDSAGNPTAQQQAIRRLASSPRFDVFAQAAGLPRAMSDRELFIRNALLAGATEEAQAPQDQTP